MSNQTLRKLTLAAMLALSASAALSPEASAMRMRGGGGGFEPGGHAAAHLPSETSARNPETPHDSVLERNPTVNLKPTGEHAFSVTQKRGPVPFCQWVLVRPHGPGHPHFQFVCTFS